MEARYRIVSRRRQPRGMAARSNTGRPIPPKRARLSEVEADLLLPEPPRLPGSLLASSEFVRSPGHVRRRGAASRPALACRLLGSGRAPAAAVSRPRRPVPTEPWDRPNMVTRTRCPARPDGLRSARSTHAGVAPRTTTEQAGSGRNADMSAISGRTSPDG
jgi:hypothetical protein